MGTPGFSRTCLKALLDSNYNVVMCVTRADKPVGRKHILTAPPVKEEAIVHNIKVFQPETLKTTEAFDTIKNANPDLIVTAAYGRILPQNILDIPAKGCLNVHGSLLPKKRGSAPVQRAVLEGDSVTGVTIMKMDAGMDTGDILTVREVPIEENIHADELMDLLGSVGSELLVETIPGYIAGDVKPVPQNGDEATYSPPIRSEEGAIDWSKSSVEIHNQIRALSEWPGAYAKLSGKKVKIYDSEKTDGEGVPGSVLPAGKKEIVIACGSGAIKIKELQTEGGKRLPASECAHNFKPDMMFGNGDS